MDAGPCLMSDTFQVEPGLRAAPCPDGAPGPTWDRPKVTRAPRRPRARSPPSIASPSPEGPRPSYPKLRPRAPEAPQAPSPQASGGWRPRRGPPTWPPIAASASRPPPSPRPGSAAPWRPPWGRGGGGGSAGSVVAGSAASRRLVVAPSLRVWRRRLPPSRSSLRPATRTPTPDPGGGKRDAIQNQCSFIGSHGGHSHCPARPALPAKTPAAHARPARPTRERALPAALARTSAPRRRAPLELAKGLGGRGWRVAMTSPEARMIETRGLDCTRWLRGERRARRAAGAGPWRAGGVPHARDPNLSTEGSSPAPPRGGADERPRGVAPAL